MQEPIELGTSGIQRFLVCLGDPWPDQRTAVLLDEYIEDLGDWQAGPWRVLPTLPDDLAADEPEIVAVPLEGS